MQEITLPKWLESRYKILWNAFGEEQFRMDDAINIFKKNLDSDKEIPVFISELKKSGWIEVELDPKDSRKRIYNLISKESRIEDFFSIDSKKISRTDIETLLKKAADLIRTRVDYKFILILLFLKRISDMWELEYEKALKEAIEDGLSEIEARKEAKNVAYHDFDLPEEFLWDNIRKETNVLPEKLSTALKKIAERNPDLANVLDDVDFIHFTSSRDNAEILRQLFELFSEKKLHYVSPDILGDSYEWILRYFAPQKAKEGEVYTPREVIKLLVQILDPKPGERVYDPASASNGMLILSFKHVEEQLGKQKANKLFLHGQEANRKTLALGRMNLYIHDIKNAETELGDTLLYPKFKDGENLKQFDIVIANPPWNQDGYSEETLKKGDFWKKRYDYGFVPKQSADWAWIQHMIASANDNTGRIGIVIDNGCLFRGGKEKAVRKKVLKDDLLESVILLPEKLFYNTGAPGAILIFRKNKPETHKNRVLVINSNENFKKHPDVRKLNYLGDEHIAKVVSTYISFQNIEGFARVVDMEEIIANDYNLNITLYVHSEEKIEKINVAKEWQKLKEIEEEICKVEDKLENVIKEIWG